MSETMESIDADGAFGLEELKMMQSQEGVLFSRRSKPWSNLGR